MKISLFLFVSAAIFLGTHGLSVFWSFLLGANVFVIWALTVFFLDRGQKLNWPVFFGVAIFFDFWSGGPFGNLVLALLLIILVIFMTKKIMLTDSRGNFSDLMWLTGFYFLYLFFSSVIGDFSDKFILPRFTILGLVVIIFWTMIMMFIHRRVDSRN